METATILLRVQGEIFIQGLTLYFEQWGFRMEPLPGEGSSPEGVPGPVLVVMDLPYPAPVHGLENELLGEGHALPLLLLVSHSNQLPCRFVRLAKVRRYACVAKPCTLKELKQAVEGLLGCKLPALAGMETEPEKDFPYPQSLPGNSF